MMHRRLTVALIAVLAMSLMAGAVWIKRVPIANWAVARMLDRQGFGPVRVGIETIGLHEMTLRGLGLCGGAVSARRVAAYYDLPALAHLQVSRVDIDGLDAALGADENGFGVGQCRLKGGGGSAIDIDELRLADAHIVVAGEGETADLRLSASMAVAGGAIEGHDLDAKIAASLGGAPRRLRIAAHGFAVAPQGPDGLRVLLNDASIESAELPIVPQGVTGELMWSAGHGEAKIAVAELAGRGALSGWAPIALRAAITDEKGMLRFTIHGSGAGNMAPLDVKGLYNRNEGRGTAAIVVGPISLGRGGVQASALLPALRGLVESVAGAVSAQGSIGFSRDGLTADLPVRLEGIGFDASGAEVRNLSGTVRLTGLWPPATAPHQELSATVAPAGLPPLRIRVEGQLTAKPALKIDKAVLSVAGGTISTGPFSIDPASPRVETALDFSRVDLGDLIDLLDINGLSGSGRLSGRVPWTVDHGKLAIGQARLAAEGPGILRYDPQRLPEALTKAGQSMTLALEALRNFHYDTLTLALEKAAEGHGTVLLQLNGSNPEVMNGQVFHFNIRVESNFDRLAEVALLNLHSVQDLLRQAAQRGQK
jgi:Dicarboxylate transport